ncbi:MAG: hypothetical protein JWM56_52 [Candidatus Peribacteria bacterium]|nr:hypothetical protein [Candidatus Peribacteria bacterium]
MKTSLLAASLAISCLSLIGCSSGSISTDTNSSSSAVASVASSGGLEIANGLRMEEPLPGSIVQSPLVVRGEAQGSWYFEASFPIRLLDSHGVELASVPAKAQGDWMTADYVPFLASISFAATTDTGSLVLDKDNPSGLPQNAGTLVIPVRFK